LGTRRRILIKSLGRDFREHASGGNEDAVDIERTAPLCHDDAGIASQLRTRLCEFAGQASSGSEGFIRIGVLASMMVMHLASAIEPEVKAPHACTSCLPVGTNAMVVMWVPLNFARR
jgi:hypothetical protein